MNRAFESTWRANQFGLQAGESGGSELVRFVTVDIPHHGTDFFQDLRERVISMNGSKRNVFETFSFRRPVIVLSG